MSVPYFWREKEECDFILEEKGRLVEAIQCSCKVGEENQERELSGLIAAMDTGGGSGPGRSLPTTRKGNWRPERVGRYDSSRPGNG